MPAVKIGVSRQLEVELRGGKVILTPKTLMDKQVEKRLDEGLEDLKQGRTYGPFDSAKDTIRSLRGFKKSKRVRKA